MPDLKNPSSKGTKMEPVFFVNGKHAPTGAFRQGAAARLGEVHHGQTQTIPVVLAGLRESRVGPMLGEGLYMPIDDMGPQTEQAQLRGARPLSRRLTVAE